MKYNLKETQSNIFDMVSFEAGSNFDDETERLKQWKKRRQKKNGYRNSFTFKNNRKNGNNKKINNVRKKSS